VDEFVKRHVGGSSAWNNEETLRRSIVGLLSEGKAFCLNLEKGEGLCVGLAMSFLVLRAGR
jgi:hypothetical protein